jgi:hypothetical protein
MVEVSCLSLLGPGAWDPDDGSGAAAITLEIERRKILLKSVNFRRGTDPPPILELERT